MLSFADSGNGLESHRNSQNNGLLKFGKAPLPFLLLLQHHALTMLLKPSPRPGSSDTRVMHRSGRPEWRHDPHSYIAGDDPKARPSNSRTKTLTCWPRDLKFSGTNDGSGGRSWGSIRRAYTLLCYTARSVFRKSSVHREDHATPRASYTELPKRTAFLTSWRTGLRQPRQDESGSVDHCYIRLELSAGL